MGLPKNKDDVSNLVSDYLLTHPDFFNDHPDILNQLNLSHITGENVASLIELQVQRLRYSNQYQQEHIEGLHRTTEQEQRLTGRVHESALEILRLETTEALFDCLAKSLEDLFNTQTLKLFVFTDKNYFENYRGLHIEKRDSKLQRMFTEVFTRNKPLCDSLQQEHIHALFGKQADIKSSLLFPGKQKDFILLFAAGSESANTYKQGYELQLIRFLFDVFVLKFNAQFKNR